MELNANTSTLLLIILFVILLILKITLKFLLIGLILNIKNNFNDLFSGSGCEGDNTRAILFIDIKGFSNLVLDIKKLLVDFIILDLFL